MSHTIDYKIGDYKIGRYTVALSQLEKVFFPPTITKLDMLNYYNNIAPIMLKYIKNRPIMLHRFPDGITVEGFYQKNASNYFPHWIKRIEIPKKSGHTDFVLCQNRATIVYLANQGCITFHSWLSKINTLAYPDKIIFDLDPSSQQPFTDISSMAIALKDLFQELKLTSFVMTTGSRGLHVIVPIKNIYTFDYVKQFADTCAKVLVSRYPDKTTLSLRKDQRNNKLFIDTLRNQFGATSVAPYSLRARSNAPVATPLYWHELQDTTLNSKKYTITTIFEKLDISSDPFQELIVLKQHLLRANELLQKLL